jgi:restriction endonuclease S subunit
LKKNEILFNNTNSQELVGKTAFFDLEGEYFCSNHITRIKVNELLIHPKYLWIILNLYQQKKKFYRICTNWNNQSGINTNLLKSVKIPLPPLKVQEEIIAIVQNGYKLKRQKENEAKNLLNSIDNLVLNKLGIKLPESDKKICYRVFFNELDGRINPDMYNPKRLNAIQNVKLSNLPIFPLQKIVDFTKEIVTDAQDLTYVGLENIESNTGTFSTSNKEKEGFGTAFLFKKGDILFPKLRPYLNKVHFAKFNGVCSTEFHVLRTRKCDGLYLFSFLRSNIVVNQTSFLMTGNTLPRLQTADIENLLIPVPSSEVQSEISNEVKSRMDKAELLQQEARELLENAKIKVERIIMGD